MAVLSVYRADRFVKRLELVDEIVRIGRAAVNDLVLDDPGKAVSRVHAEIRLEQGQYVVVDLNSQNGVWIGNRRVHVEAIPRASAVTIGDYRLVLEPETVAQAEPSPAPWARPLAGIGERAADSVRQLGRYELLEPVGRGSMGALYRGRDTVLDRTVAVKVMGASFHGDSTARDRFFRAAKAAARLQHSNIVTVFEFGEHDEIPYIVMELLKGCSLADRLAQESAMTLPAKLDVVIQLCAGLDFAHSSGVVHGAVKPENVWLSEDGTIKLLDFGIATAASSTMTFSDLVGSPGYLSPEQVSGQEVDSRSDIFATGVLLCELLSGRLPFEADSPTGIMLKVVNDAPSSLLEALGAGCPPELVATVLRTLAKDPRQRFARASDLANRLRTIRAGLAKSPSSLPASFSDFPTPTHEQRPQPEGWMQPTEADSATRYGRAQRLGLAAGLSALVLGGASLTASQAGDLGHGWFARAFAEHGLRIAVFLAATATASWCVALWPRAVLAPTGASAKTPSLSATSVPTTSHNAQPLTRCDDSPGPGPLAEIVAPNSPPSSHSAAWGGDAEPIETVLAPLAPNEHQSPATNLTAPISVSPTGFRVQMDSDSRRVDLYTDSSDPLTANRHSDQTTSSAENASEGVAAATVFFQDMKRPEEPIARTDESIILPPVQLLAGPTSASLPLPGVQLVVTHCDDGRLTGRAFPIASVPFEIGRSDEASLRLSLFDCSRRHAMIEQDENGFTIRDLGSSNGTFLNGRQVRTAEPLFINAKIAIGQTRLSFMQVADTSLPDLTGSVLDDRYELTTLLRSTVRGAVYSARDKRTLGKIAVKLLSPRLARDFPSYFDQFIHEAKTAAELSHPHICTVLDHRDGSVVQNGRLLVHAHFLCLRLMDGGSLADRIRTDAAQEVGVVNRWLGQVAAGLDYAHGHRVVHGALKPSAIVFDESGNAYVTDFSSGHHDSPGGRRNWLGTPAFIAPEQWDGGEWTAATDQFACAAIVYYALTGVVPFEGQDHPEIRRRNFARGPVPVHEEASAKGARRSVLERASGTLQRALSIDPNSRFGSVGEFAHDLVASLEAELRRPFIHDVFISYVRKRDSGWASLFARELYEKHAISVFLDVKFQDGAGRFPDRLSQAIASSKVFICFLNAATLKSKWVTQEIKAAHRFQIPMIPIFQESFRPLDLSGSVDPSIVALLQSDGVHLLDERNLHIEHSVNDIANLVKRTVGRR